MKPSASRIFIALAIIAFCSSPAALMARRSHRFPKPIKSHRDPPPPPNKVDVLLHTYDPDHDDELDEQEMASFKAGNPSEAASALTFDTDHDGTLSSEEIAAWRLAETNH